MHLALENKVYTNAQKWFATDLHFFAKIGAGNAQTIN